MAPRALDAIVLGPWDAVVPLPDVSNGWAIARLATDDEVAGVTGSLGDFFAGVNAGDEARRYAFYTDRWVDIIGPPPADALEAGPLPADRRVTLVGVYDAVAFEDGRVGAVVVFDDPDAPAPAEAFFWVFRVEEGHWKLDDVPSESMPYRDSATPAPSPRPLPPGASVVDPAACVVAPRTLDEVIGLIDGRAEGEGPAIAVAPTLTDSAPPPQVEAAIADTIRQQLACANANDQLRVWALWTDANVAARDPEDLDLVVEPTPRPEAERNAFVGMRAFRELSDGRVGAALVIDDPATPSPIDTLFAVFGEEDGRWLLDAVYSHYSTVIYNPDGARAELMATPEPRERGRDRVRDRDGDGTLEPRRRDRVA
jgi:hypothetical protein